MAIGRIGDFINGEHIAKETDLPWGVVYTHPDSPGFTSSVTATGEFIARHPATTYEMIGDLLIVGVLALVFQRVWKHRPGIVFFLGVVLYSAMRFGVSYLRLDSCPSGVDCPEYIVSNWMTFPQVVSFITFCIGMVGLIWSLMRAPQEAPGEPAAASPPSGRQTARA
jgi:phosphatidylglycerol:prolipoprotein diacylglycerol transferase